MKIPSPNKDLNDWTRNGATWEDIEEIASRYEILKDVLPQNTEAAAYGESDLDYAYEGQSVLQTAKDGRILVPLPINRNRLLSEFASDLGRALCGKGLYNRGGLVFLLNTPDRNLSLVTPDAFRTWSEKHVVCYKVEKSEDDTVTRLRKSMTKSDAGAVLAAHQFLTHLPTIRKLNQVRLPVLRKSGRIELLPVGFDTESQTYTFDSPGLDYPKELALEQAKQVLDSLFIEFCFRPDGGRSLAVVVAGMMTMFGMGLLPEGALPPCFMVMANAEGAGKTLLVKVMVTPIAGTFVVASKPQSEEELRKRLTVSVMDGESYEVLDNVKEHLENLSGSLLCCLIRSKSERSAGNNGTHRASWFFVPLTPPETVNCPRSKSTSSQVSAVASDKRIPE